MVEFCCLFDSWVLGYVLQLLIAPLETNLTVSKKLHAHLISEPAILLLEDTLLC